MNRASILVLAVAVAACNSPNVSPDGGGGDGGGGGSTDGGGSVGPSADAGAVTVTAGERTYLLEESPASVSLWTTPATRRTRASDRPPMVRRSGLRLSAARNEFEPSVLLVGPGSGTVRVSIAPFANLGAGQRVSLSRARYEMGWAEHLDPLGTEGSIALDAAAPTPVWLTVYVPSGAPAGDHETVLTVTPEGGAAVRVLVRLHVFDFALPREVHFDSQFNLSVAALRTMGGTVDAAKTLLFEHRFTPSSVSWPSGFRYDITWENPRNTMRCERFWDEPTEGAEFAIGRLSRRYMLGEGWNGVGFPSAMVLSFVDNATPRPARLCDIDRGDHFGTAAYNAEWSQYLRALRDYLQSNAMLSRGYYYVQNEPQGPEDYRLAAHLCRMARAAAPGLRLAISEEPKPALAEHAEGACGWDVWIAALQQFQEDYAVQRQRDRGETLWFYSLDHDPEPYFNPTRVDREGTHERVIPWVSWRYRARGWAYYDAGRFFDGANPTVRAELLREGFEDYEYLYLANGGAHAPAGTRVPVDATVQGLASSLTSWNSDPEAFDSLRHELGRFIARERDTLPVLQSMAAGRPRGAYAVNFQDPAGRPTASPLVVAGREHLKVGWQPWSDALGYGFFGENIANPMIAKYGYDDVASFDEAQRSYLYDDYGRPVRFEFALAPGRYRVTIGAGRPARGYPGDPQNVVVEGVRVIDDVATSNAAPTLRREATVELLDGRLTVEAGGRSRSTGNYAYTFLAYMLVDPM